MRTIMNTRSAAILWLASSVFAGCSTYSPQEAIIAEALQEREAAYVRLAKAITAYCSMSTETINARQACIVEQQLTVLQSENGQRILPIRPSPSRLRSSR